MLDNVKCPNMCDDGKIKHNPDSTKALFIHIKCPYCKGKGFVNKNKVKEIEAMI